METQTKTPEERIEAVYAPWQDGTPRFPSLLEDFRKIRPDRQRLPHLGAQESHLQYLRDMENAFLRNSERVKRSRGVINLLDESEKSFDVGCSSTAKKALIEGKTFAFLPFNSQLKGHRDADELTDLREKTIRDYAEIKPIIERIESHFLMAMYGKKLFCFNRFEGSSDLPSSLSVISRYKNLSMDHILRQEGIDPNWSKPNYDRDHREKVLRFYKEHNERCSRFLEEITDKQREILQGCIINLLERTNSTLQGSEQLFGAYLETQK